MVLFCDPDMEVEGFQQSLRVALFTCVTVTVMTYLACEMWSMKDRRADPQTDPGRHNNLKLGFYYSFLIELVGRFINLALLCSL